MIVAGALAIAAVSPAHASETSETNENAETTQVGAAASAVQVKKGQVIYGGNGRRIGKVFRVSPEGDAQVIIGTRLETIPAGTLTEADGKISTTLTSRDFRN